VAVLTNSTNGDPLAHEVFTATGFDPTPIPTPPANPVPIDDRMCGTYRNPLYDITLTSTSLTYRPRNDLAASFRGTTPVEVVRLNDDSIITTGTHEVMSLIGSDEAGRAKYLHNGGAAYRIA
jgi:hypothetical protein